MELQTISQVTKAFSLSTRTLRYYEQIGLIQSEKKEGYAYRVYTEDTVNRLKQIVILRKLRIPLKQIAEILQNDNATMLIEAFQKNLSEIDEELTALSTIRDIIRSFITRLNESISSNINVNLLDDTELIEAVDSISVKQVPIKEEKTAADLQAASEKLNKLTDRDVRIIYLPPMTVASICTIGHDTNGNHAEYTSGVLLDEFINNSNLKKSYPSARVFGFNNPDGVPDDDIAHGYERWISIPNDMEVSAPFNKKHLAGGLYAAHTIVMGDWEEWKWLCDWVSGSKIYDFRWGTVKGVCGWLEEHLNYWEWDIKYDGKVNYLDLLIPIKIKGDKL